MTCSKDKNEVVFNELYLDYEKPIKICEGPFDMIKCGNNATCLQGSELNEESKLFQEILLNGSKVILCLDNDMKFKTQKIARKLFEYGIEVKVLQIRNANDPGEMNKKELDEQINNNSESFSWHSYMREKINNKILGI
jgi:DNA primase